jgi:hypothetical protein
MPGLGEGQKAANRQHDENGNDQWSAFHEWPPRHQIPQQASLLEQAPE